MPSSRPLLPRDFAELVKEAERRAQDVRETWALLRVALEKGRRIREWVESTRDRTP